MNMIDIRTRDICDMIATIDNQPQCSPRRHLSKLEELISGVFNADAS